MGDKMTPQERAVSASRESGRRLVLVAEVQSVVCGYPRLAHKAGSDG